MVTLSNTERNQITAAVDFAVRSMNSLIVTYPSMGTTSIVQIFNSHGQKNGICNLLHALVIDYLIGTYPKSWCTPTYGKHDIELTQQDIKYPIDIKTSTDFSLKGNRSWALNPNNPPKTFIFLNIYIEEWPSRPHKIKVYLARYGDFLPRDFDPAAKGQFCFLKQQNYSKFIDIGTPALEDLPLSAIPGIGRKKLQEHAIRGQFYIRDVPVGTYSYNLAAVKQRAHWG